MKEVVVDASTTLAWCFPDEASDYADIVLLALEGGKHLGQSEIGLFTTLLDGLFIVQDMQPVSEYVSNVLPMAREYGLSAQPIQCTDSHARRKIAESSEAGGHRDLWKDELNS